MVPIGERSSTFPNDREPDSHDDDDEPIHHSVVLEHNGSLDPARIPRSIPPEFLRSRLATCLMQPTYLDHFYAVQPGRPNEAKRIVGFFPRHLRERCDPDRVANVGEIITLACSNQSVPECAT
jgi:hypothetical protein